MYAPLGNIDNLDISILTAKKKGMRPERESCREHPDEEVHYFCFDCLNPPICAECVVRFAHKNHEVATIRKAYP